MPLQPDMKSDESADRTVDKRWMDEYAKRTFAFQIWRGLAVSSTFASAMTATNLLIDHVNSKDKNFHPVKTPAALVALCVTGAIPVYLWNNQVGERSRLHIQRLARRITGVMPDQVKNAPPIKWSEIFIPGRLRRHYPGGDSVYNSKWINAYSKAGAISTGLACVQIGVLGSAVSHITQKQLAQSAGTNFPYNKNKMPLLLAGLAITGIIACYTRIRQHAKMEIMEDNYLARLIALQNKTDNQGSEKEALGGNADKHLPVPSQRRSRNTSVAELDNISSPSDFISYDKTWIKEYRRHAFLKEMFTVSAKATFLGMFSVLVGMGLNKAARKKIEFDIRKSPQIFAKLMLFGAVCSYLEAGQQGKVTRLVDNRVAHRINSRRTYDESVMGHNMTKDKAPSNYWQNKVTRVRSSGISLAA